MTLCRSQNGLDVMYPETIAKNAGEQVGHFQLILDATGALEINGNGPEKSFSSMDQEKMMDQFVVNAIGPAIIIKHFMKILL